MNIDIIDDLNVLTDEQTDLLTNVLQYVAQGEAISDLAELSLTIVNNNEIQQLNKNYRDKDVPTDVLSFPLDEDWIPVEGMPQMLGDIIISHEKVDEQKNQFGHAYERELCFLAVHGLLHLIGYTHNDEIEEKQMFAKQEHYLQKFGLER